MNKNILYIIFVSRAKIRDKITTFSSSYRDPQIQTDENCSYFFNLGPKKSPTSCTGSDNSQINVICVNSTIELRRGGLKQEGVI